MTKLKEMIDQIELRERLEENYDSIRFSAGVYLGKNKHVPTEILQNPKHEQRVREEVLLDIKEGIMWDAYGPLKNELHQLHAEVARLRIRPEGFDDLKKALKRLSALIDSPRLGGTHGQNNQGD